MPQLTIEYTPNIIEKNNFSDLFQTCHEILAQKLPAALQDCKSRAIQQNEYYMGAGEPNNAFVMVHLKCMEGRSKETLQMVMQEIMHTLQNHFATSLKQLNLQITLQLEELTHDKYFKVG